MVTILRAQGNRTILALATGILEPVTLAGRLQDVTAMRLAIQHGAGQTLAAEHLGPLTERHVLVTITL